MSIDLKRFKTIEDLPDDPQKLKAIIIAAFARVETIAQEVAVLEHLSNTVNRNKLSSNEKLFIDMDQQTG